MVLDQNNYSRENSHVFSTIVKDKGVGTNIAMHQKENKEDKDFIINELSRDEIDLQIQFNRIMYVLQRAIDNIKIVAYLPTLVEDNGKLLKEYFEEGEIVDFILSICERDQFMSEGIGQRSINLRKKETSPPVLKNTKIDPAMVEIIALLYNNRQINKNVVANENVKFGEGPLKLIDTMKMLHAACEQKLKLNAAQEKSRQNKLRNAWRDNMIVQKEVEHLQQKLDNQREQFEVDINSKEKIIEDYEDKMKIATEKFKEKMNKRVAESEKIMGLEAAASEMKIETLTVEAKRVQVEYQALLENHISDEKNLRAKRLKVETQLATWLAKYDQDIGERHNEIETLTKEYDKEKAEMDALQEKYDEQEDEYDELMEEKALEDRRIFEIKMYKIISNIAARKIQRAWKAYWLRKQARLRAKKARARDKKGSISPGARIAIKEKKPKKKKDKKDKKPVGSKIHGGTNMIEDLNKMVKGDLLDDLTTPAFNKAAVNVDL